MKEYRISYYDVRMSRKELYLWANSVMGAWDKLRTLNVSIIIISISERV